MNVGSVRLDPGAHRSPSHGVCLLELASLMAREKFSDRPRCVCVVIAAFLRDWNDRSGYAQRQRLRPYARRVIGSRAGRSVTHRRRDVCLIWAGADLSGNWVSRAFRRTAMRLRILAILGIRPALRLNEGAGQLAARVVFSRYDSRDGTEPDRHTARDRLGARARSCVGRDGRDGDALARAVVESAVRPPGAAPRGPRRPTGMATATRTETATAGPPSAGRACRRTSRTRGARGRGFERVGGPGSHPGPRARWRLGCCGSRTGSRARR